MAYRFKDCEPDFSAAWDEAVAAATDAMVSEARRRAVRGTDEPVFYQGAICGVVRKYSDTLLMFLIKKERPEYRDTQPDRNPPAPLSSVPEEVSGRMLAAVGGPDGPELSDDPPLPRTAPAPSAPQSG